MPKILSFKLWSMVNAIAVAFILIGAYLSMALHVVGWAMLFAGVLVCGFIECALAPLTGRPGGSLVFWHFADAIFIPACVAVNGALLWILRRIYTNRHRTS